MKLIITLVYMFVCHPILFFRYSIRRRSKYFLVRGASSKIHTKGLILKSKVRLGDDTRIDFYANGRLSIGEKCYLGNRNSFLVGADITIGNRVLMASDVMIASENHIPKPEQDDIYGDLDMRPVVIGDGCWIAEKVCIMPGVQIGDYSVVGAASVVTKSIPSYSIAVGNPAKVIKKYNFNKHIWEKVTE